MIFKKFKQLYAPSVFRFPDPDTGRMFVGASVSDLVTQVQGYRYQNDLEELEFLPMVITNYLCSLPEHKGLCQPLRNPKRSIMQFVQGGIALLKNIAYKDFVSQEEADKRSETCAACPHNEFPNRIHFPKWADEIATLSVGEHKAIRHNDLGICGLCSCPLRPKVWYKGKIKLTSEQLNSMKVVGSVKCWQPDFAEVK